MTWKELRDYAEEHNITDDFYVTVIGMCSGPFGDVKSVKLSAAPTPDGDFKELQLGIDA